MKPPSRAKKLLIVNSSNKFWGAEVSLLIFLKSLDSIDYELVVRKDGEGFSSELQKNDLSYSMLQLELSPFKKGFYKSVFKLMKLVAGGKISSIYANNEDLSTLIAVLKILFFFRLKTYMHIRTTPGIHDYYKKIMFLHDGVICNSHFTKRSLLKRVVFRFSKKIHVVPNSHGQNIVEQEVSSEFENYFVSVGRVSVAKGQFEVVKALKQAGARLDSKYLMLGGAPDSDPHVQEINSYLKRNNMQDRVFIYPFKKDLSSIYRNAVATIVSSTKETFGRVVIESGVYGTPVIVRNIEPLVDFIKDGENGLIWDGSQEHLVDLLTDISSDMAYRNSLGSNFKKLVLEVYSDDKYCGELKKIIQDS